jgi:hypothetical protein
MSRPSKTVNPHDPIVLRARDGSILAREVSPGTFDITCRPDQRDDVIAELEERMTDRLEADVPPLTADDKRKLARMASGRSRS